MTPAPLSTVLWQCGRKRRYWTKAEAKDAARAMHAKTGRHYRRYVCPHCGHYHLATRKGGDTPATLRKQ